MLSSFWRCCLHLPKHRNSLNALSYNTIQRAKKVLKSHDRSSHVNTHHVFSRREQQLAARQINNERSITAVIKKCNINLRNYWRIASKVTHDLKIQLVHAGVLSIIDNCNAVYGGLSEADLQKLQKIQNCAVRFIFGLTGKQKYQSISPYLKKLHFLPVRYRIQYKIALLVFKCLNNIAPHYLSELISTRDATPYSLRLDNDFYLLKQPDPTNLVRTRAAFSVSGPLFWNQLPHELRSQQELVKFKRLLKTHYFNQAFARV